MEPVFQFENLPAELRDLIYEYVSLDSGAVLMPSNNGKCSSSASLARVSRNVRDEYIDGLCVSAPVVTAYVQDFDFTHVSQFFDALKELETENAVEGIPIAIKPSVAHRRLDIVFLLTQECRSHLDKLRAWLQQICSQTSDHYSTAFETTYSIHESTVGAGPTSTIAPITLMRIIDEVHHTWYLRTSIGTLKNEIGKVCDCLGEAELRINRMRTGSLASGPRMGGLEVF